ncbi:hypothetical protein PINS_up006323 [Pythium insidiosum]|nr:hypothetical protein PINS_up006323 [Pythium insidiosum]
MRLTTWMLAAAATLMGALVAAQDTDEFDGVEAAKPKTSEFNFEPLPPQDRTYWVEGATWLFVGLYGVNYLLGKRKNRQIADEWLEASEPHLVKEFAYTGSSAEPRVGLLVDSTNNFKYYCTGRRFCSRLVVDLELKSRHDIFSRVLGTIISSPDYLTFDVGLNALDLDPIVFAISKKTQFNSLVKLFPELVSLAKRLPSNDVPESFCVAADNIETPKTAMTRQLVKHLEVLEPFLDYVVISDISTLPIAGFPNSEKRVMRIRFTLQNGSNKLDKAAAVAFMAYLIDAIGSTMKLSRDLKLSAQKKRAKYALERGPSKRYSNGDCESPYRQERKRHIRSLFDPRSNPFTLGPVDSTQDSAPAHSSNRRDRKDGDAERARSVGGASDMEELLHPLLRVPFEKANKSFRLFHKQLTRDVAAVQRQILAMRQEQPAAQHAAVAETIAQLETIADEIRRVQKQTKTFIGEQQREVESCVTRAQFAQSTSSRPDEKAPSTTQCSQHQQQHEARLVADYLLCRGFVDSSRLVQERRGIGFLVDHELHLEHQSILNDLHAHNLTTAIEWCADNGSRLRRMQSRLEFQLRLQEFIELVRSDKKLEAIQYAQAHLTPLTMQHDNEEIRKSMMDSIQEAMATLAFKSPDKCGVESYSRLFSEERWPMLKDLFRTTFFEVYGIHNPPSLCVALFAGLSTLNTRTCRRTREARAAALKRPASSGIEEAIDDAQGTTILSALQSGDATTPRRGKKIRFIPDNEDDDDDVEEKDRRRTKRKTQQEAQQIGFIRQH